MVSVVSAGTHRFEKKIYCSGVNNKETLRPVSTVSHAVIFRQLLFTVCVTNFFMPCRRQNEILLLRVGRGAFFICTFFVILCARIVFIQSEQYIIMSKMLFDV